MNIQIFREKTYFPLASKVVPHIVLYVPGDKEITLQPTSYSPIALGIGFALEPGQLMMVANHKPLCTGDTEHMMVNSNMVMGGQEIIVFIMNLGSDPIVLKPGDPICIAYLARLVQILPGDEYEAKGGTLIPVTKEDIEKKRKIEEVNMN